MPTLYERILSSRLDMTNWLLHFTHYSTVLPEYEGTVFGAQDILLKILGEGVLKPSFAIRNGKHTVYGPHPAVCFTEQPLWAFIEYLDVVDVHKNLAGYGLAVHKHDASLEGAKPVIYGLSSDPRELRSGDDRFDPERRTLDSSSLPLDEQYRYCTFVPNRDAKPIDWSHEREWRWSAKNDRVGVGGYRFDNTGHMVQGKREAEGRVIVVVKAEEDIEWLQQQAKRILDYQPPPDSGANVAQYARNWKTHMVSTLRILSLERVRSERAKGRQEFARIDTWPSEHLAKLL